MLGDREEAAAPPRASGHPGGRDGRADAATCRWPGRAGGRAGGSSPAPGPSPAPRPRWSLPRPPAPSRPPACSFPWRRPQPPPGDSCPPGFSSFFLSRAAADCNVADPAMSTASQLGPGSNPLPNLNETSSSSVPHGAAPGLRSDAAGGGGGGTGKQPSQFVYVFTTHLANT